MKFIDILIQLNIEYRTEGHHHCRSGWINLDCPFCGKDTYSWHMGYSLEGNYVNCWRCGSHPLIKTLMEITDYPFLKCKKILKDVKTTETIKEKPKGKLTLPKGIKGLRILRPHRRYLKNRGFDWKEIMKLWQVAGIGLSSQLSWRIFIPIIYHGKIVSWTTRSVSKNSKATRYLSASPKEESMPLKSLLYGEDFARETIIIVEGPFDVWRIGPGAVATLGTNYSNMQIFRMLKYQKRVVCFDNEVEAQKRAKKLCDNLSIFPGETYNVQLNAKDAATASKEEIETLRKNFL